MRPWLILFFWLLVWSATPEPALARSPAISSPGSIPGAGPATAPRPDELLSLLPATSSVALETQSTNCCPQNDCECPLALSGHIRDANGTPITGVKVSLTQYTHADEVTTSDASGRYDFGVRYGGYMLTAEKSGYLSQSLAVFVGSRLFCCIGSCPIGPQIQDLTLATDHCELWSTVASDPVARAAAVAVPTTSTRAYVLGGANGSGYLARSAYYEQTTNSWATAPSMPVERAGFAAGLIGNAIYVAGGINAAGAIIQTSRYDLGTGTWTASVSPNPMPLAGWGVAGAVHGGRLWVSGGYDGVQPTVGTAMRAFDPATGNWTSYTPMSWARSWHAMASFDGKLFVIGGIGAEWDVQIFNPASGLWSTGPQLPLPLKDITAVADVAQNRLLVIGGTTGDGASGTEVDFKTVLQLRPGATANTYVWSYLNAYPTSGAGTSAAILGGRPYVFGGRTAYPATYFSQTHPLLPAPIPTAPASVSVAPSADNSSVRVSWSAVGGAASYQITRTGGTGAPSWNVAAGSSSFLDDTSVEEGTPYTYEVRADNGCGGLSSPRTASITVHYPVVLVHGICSDPSAWDAWAQRFQAAGMITHRVDLRRLDSLRRPIAFSANQEIQVSAGLLRDKISTIQGRVNIVAHSMGGIVSRYYIEQMGGDPRVNKLVMVGSPNHGCGAKRIAPTVAGFYLSGLNDLLYCLIWGQADNQLGVNSEFLRTLNYGTAHGVKDEQCPGDRGNGAPELIAAVADRYWTIAGTGSQTGITCSAVTKRSETWRCRTSNKTSDGFISVGSVQLDALPSGHNLIDFDLVGRHLYHAKLFSNQTLNAAAQCSESLLDNTTLADKVAMILNNQTPTRTPEVAPLEPRLATQAPPVDSLDAVDLPEVSLALASGGVQEVPIPIPSTPEVTFYGFNSRPGELAIRLRTPSGLVLSPVDTSTVPGLAFIDESPAGIQFFTVGAPESGTWSVILDASTATGPQSVTVVSQIRSNAGLEAVMDTTSSNGQIFLRLTGMPIEAGTLVPGASVSATLIGPSGSAEPIALFDDATHGDSVQGDGVFTALAAITSGSGNYGADIRGEWNSAAGPTHRASTTGYVINSPIDLAVDSTGIVLSTAIPDSGAYVTASILVRNLGSSTAEGAVVRWRTLGIEEQGETVITVAGHDSAWASIPWRAVGGDTVSLQASAMVSSGGELDYGNNLATRSIILGPSVVSAPPQPAQRPSRFEMLPPRPNPTSGSASFVVLLPRAGRVDIEIFDVAGRSVRKLTSGDALQPGSHTFTWDGRSKYGNAVPNGIYLIRVRAGRDTGVQRVTLLH